MGSITALRVADSRLHVPIICSIETFATFGGGLFPDFRLFANEFEFARDVNFIFLLKLRSEHQILGTCAHLAPSKKQSDDGGLQRLVTMLEGVHQDTAQFHVLQVVLEAGTISSEHLLRLNLV